MISIKHKNGIASIDEKLIRSFNFEINGDKIILKINPENSGTTCDFVLIFDYEEGKIENLTKDICNEIAQKTQKLWRNE